MLIHEQMLCCTEKSVIQNDHITSICQLQKQLDNFLEVDFISIKCLHTIKIMKF